MHRLNNWKFPVGRVWRKITKEVPKAPLLLRLGRHPKQQSCVCHLHSAVRNRGAAHCRVLVRGGLSPCDKVAIRLGQVVCLRRLIGVANTMSIRGQGFVLLMLLKENVLPPSALLLEI